MLRFLEARFVELSAAHRSETDDLKRFHLDAQLKAVYSCLEFFRKSSQRYYTLKILMQCFLVKLRLKTYTIPVPVVPVESANNPPNLSVVPNPTDSQESSVVSEQGEAISPEK